jgi:hypothetical protein
VPFEPARCLDAVNNSQTEENKAMSRSTDTRRVALSYAHWVMVALVAACGGSDDEGSTTIVPSTSAGSGTQAQAGAGNTATAGPPQPAAAGTISMGSSATGTAGTPGASTAGMTSPSPAGASGSRPGGVTAGSGTTAGAPAMTAGTGGSGMSMPMATPCNPADKTADAAPVEFAAPGEGQPTNAPSGPYKPMMESDPGIPTHTVVRPEPLGEIKHPILAWGQGGCRKRGNEGQNTNLFKEFASHGFIIIADGPAQSGGPTMPGSGGEPLLFALEWARKENARPCSKYYQKLNVEKVAVSGQSCGGIMAIQAAKDPKITTAFLYNSGLFARDESVYSALHAPMAIFDGGPDDIAYANGLADFNAIDNIPILFANPTSCSSNAHLCTFFEPSAGQFGRAGVAWMRWHLLDDEGPSGKGMFIGTSCGMCGPEWTVEWKNAPM